MTNTTTNYGLTKPTQDEFYNVDVQNGNMDIIDTKLKEANTQLSERVKKSTVNITYYVATTGSDTNDGLTSGTAFKTIQHAIDVLPQVINHTITINIANGTYNEDVFINGLLGYGKLFIYGNQNILNDNVIVNSISIYNCNIRLETNGLKVNSTTKTGFDIYMSRNVIITYCKTDISATACIGVAVSEGSGAVTNCLLSNKLRGVSARANSLVTVYNNSGTGNIVGMYAESSVIMKNGTNQTAGTTNETALYGGVIR